MNVADALYALVHDYAGGAKALAARVGMNVHVLYSKVNPNIKTHQPTVFELMQWMALSGDHRTLRAQNEELGYLPPIPRVSADVSDTALLESYTKLISELGDFSTKFHLALADGRVTKKEVKRLRSEMLDFVGAGEELLNRLEQIAER
ncbi:phage regulatory CII family protein [Thiobacillus sp.]|uniref:phage regulatory CII family protein n=1 Tax=Thiobacillus sp. TaxID=924 RepID=UPI00179AEAAA|nr:phage regulatory CII family protein [Thiobacillus sp.]MBC2731364.1 hypothetical protein [Thiobacillus sp.]MBC2740101.1 phage regulatory CII family protein [Thiobacillus sp.]MBC2758313.1 phage regulatory CII family protein [Thiobacillus sp.]